MFGKKKKEKAEATPAPVPEEAGGEGKKRFPRWLLFVLIGVVVIIVGTIIAFFFLRKSPPPEPDVALPEVVLPETDPAIPGRMPVGPLEIPLVVSEELSVPLRISLDVIADGPEGEIRLLENLDGISSAVEAYFDGRMPEDFDTVGDKLKMKYDLTAAVNRLVGMPPVAGLYITEFLIQWP